ncbi:MAG: methylated-DNA--[protein]-cysteine S-methyltransferase [Bacteroidales bacterium]|nr:methylated-DNA--[protein]-cysteine S-methyltransferase [Bacteroidales bacterium]
MKNINIQYYKSIIGELIIGSYDGKLCIIDTRYRKMRDRIDNRIKTHLKAEYIIQNSEVIKETIKQLEEYFVEKRDKFDIPFIMLGSDFQKQVWEELINIPYGTTVSYKALSEKIGNPKAVRAVANANGANAISIIIPCHRVVASNGGLGGYAGGLKAKKLLLNVELANLKSLLPK